MLGEKKVGILLTDIRRTEVSQPRSSCTYFFASTYLVYVADPRLFSPLLRLDDAVVLDCRMASRSCLPPPIDTIEVMAAAFAAVC